MSIFVLGIVGASILVLGSLWPDTSGNPCLSKKNILLALGAVLMFLFALLSYLDGSGSIFFVFLEGLALVATVLMFASFPELFEELVIAVAGIGFVGASLYLAQGLATVWFILGLTGVSLGYVLQPNTIRRFGAFTVGSVLLAFFSFLDGNWIFFWLNLCFALSSFVYFVQHLINQKKAA